MEETLKPADIIMALASLAPSLTVHNPETDESRIVSIELDLEQNRVILNTQKIED